MYKLHFLSWNRLILRIVLSSRGDIKRSIKVKINEYSLKHCLLWFDRFVEAEIRKHGPKYEKADIPHVILDFNQTNALIRELVVHDDI